MLFSLFLGEVVNLGPMIIPRLQPLLAELLGKLRIDWTFERGKSEPI